VKNIDKDEVVKLYRDELIPVDKIYKQLNTSRQNIYNILKSEGVETSKKIRIERTCPVCEKRMLIHRCLARRTKHTFCSDTCWWIYYEVSKERYDQRNSYKRLALGEIKIHFPAIDIGKHSIHFKDGDRTHFNANNLVVFEIEEDHLKFHKGYKVASLWEG
jgi:hypothetical protein